MALYFYLILGTAVVLQTIYTLSTRGMFYNTPDTDNELMSYAAAQSHKWRWFSDVHKYAASSYKVSMKEWTVILLSIFQRVLRDRTSDRPYTVMTGMAVSICGILIYLIGENYFSPIIGFIMAITYLISFWPWQVSLYGGHANMANLFFLLSIYSILLTATSIASLSLIAIGGICFGLCLFSSASSHKYIVAVFAALFFSQNNAAGSLPLNYLLQFDLFIITLLLSAFLLINLSYKSVVRKMYDNKAPAFLNKMMSQRDSFTLEHYINHAHKKIRRAGRWIFWLVFFLLTLINSIPLVILLTFLTGLVFVFLLLTLPNVKENFSYYIAYMLETQRKTHFRSYIDDFSKRGITVYRNTRGAGLSWIPKIFWIFAPFNMTLFIAAFTMGQYKSFVTGDAGASFQIVILAIISLSPIIWAEITKAPQVSRLYSPGLITILLLPAYVLHGFEQNVYFWALVPCFLILSLMWNLKIFVKDVYPSRMTVRNLVKIINKLGIKDIYTYETSYNAHLINAIPGIGKSQYLPEKNIPPPIKIHYIKSLDEVNNGWIAIPGIDRISMNLKNNIEDDFTNDKKLNGLIETGKMDSLAVAKLKTYSTSSIWSHEDEVTSYCVLYLKNIPDDKRGSAWLVHSSKLSSNIY